METVPKLRRIRFLKRLTKRQKAINHSLEITSYARGLSDFEADFGPVLQKLSKEVLQRVRAKIKQSAFSTSARKRLAKAVYSELRPKSVLFVSVDPLWSYLFDGRRKQQMTWLRKAQKPIPIVTESGKIIFRAATPKSMRNGKWIFPGRPPIDIFSQVIKEARLSVKKTLKKELLVRLKG